MKTRSWHAMWAVLEPPLHLWARRHCDTVNRGVGPARRRAAGAAAGHDARAAEVPIHGTRRGRPHLDRRRHSRRSHHLLPRLRVGRRVEVDRRRPDVRADLRRSARRRDRRDRRRRQRSEHRLGRHGRVVGDPLQRRHGRRRLQSRRTRARPGRTWACARPAASSRVLIHPTNPNIVYVCATGRLTGPQEERGVFKTTDGGSTGSVCMFVDAEHRLLRPVDGREGSEHAVRGHWQVEQHTWVQCSGGPGSGVYVTKRRRRDVDEGRPAACRGRRSARSTSPIAPSD